MSPLLTLRLVRIFFWIEVLVAACVIAGYTATSSFSPLFAFSAWGTPQIILFLIISSFLLGIIEIPRMLRPVDIHTSIIRYGLSISIIGVGMFLRLLNP